LNITGGTIYLKSGTAGADWRLKIEGGKVENTANNGRTIYNDSPGAITISGGMVSATGTNGRAVHNNSTGAVTISGGTVSATGTGGYAVFNNSTGVVTITTPPAVINGEKYGVE
jgi:hypothetical protein